MTVSDESRQLAEQHVQVGAQWFHQGKLTRTWLHMSKALALNPRNGLACIWQAVILLARDDTVDIRPNLRTALQNLPRYAPETTLCRWLLAQLGDPVEQVSAAIDPAAKLYFRSHYTHFQHRSGWAYATAALQPLHHPDGVLFESFLESPFIWELEHAVHNVKDLWLALEQMGWQNMPPQSTRGVVPFSEPWVGILHNPPNIPDWYQANQSPEAMFATPEWQHSLPTCRGLFTLSEYAAAWVRQRVDVPVSVLTLPTEIPDEQFEWAQFESNSRKQVVQIGWWLRDLTAIFRLDAPADWHKTYLVPNVTESSDSRLMRLRQRECAAMGWDIAAQNGTESVSYLANDAYDALLAQNVVFIKLYDASANNAVIECIARATPLLINRLPAVVEYLGEEYPLYYDDLAEAARHLADFGRIHAAHRYLKECPTRSRLSEDAFHDAMVASEVYQRL